MFLILIKKALFVRRGLNGNMHKALSYNGEHRQQQIKLQPERLAEIIYDIAGVSAVIPQKIS